MQIDGKPMGTSSVTRGLARHRRNQDANAKAASEKAGHPKMPETHDGAGSTHDHGGEEGGHEEIQKVVGEHGPAHTVEVKKEGEHHTVHSTHEDGHKHTSKGHPSASHVGTHISTAAGSGGEEGQSDEGMDDNGAESLQAMGVGGE